MSIIEVRRPEDFSAGNFRRSAEQFASNYPGDPEEAPDLGSLAVKYGPPTVASMIPGVGPAALAGISALSEIGGQQVAKGLHVPTGGEALEAGLAGAGSYFGSKVIAPVLNFLGNKVMNVGARVLNRILVPKEFYTSNEYLPGRKLFELLKQLGSSPTPGQVMDTDLVNAAEGFARGALFGGKVIRNLDKKNMKLITDNLMDYVNSHAQLAFEPNPFDSNGLLKALAKSRYGQLVEGILSGKLNVAKLINAQNYDTFRRTITGQGITVEAKALFDLLKEWEKNPHMQSVTGSINQWLKPLEEKVLQPVVKETGLFDSTGKAMTQTVMEEVSQPGTRIPAENAYEILRELNTFHKSSRGERWAANEAKKALDPEFKSSLSLSGIPEALESYEKAQSVLSNLSTNLDTKLINSLVKKWRETPEAILQAIEGSSNRWSTAQKIKTAFITDAEGLTRGSLADYNRYVVEPYRYHIIQKSLDPQTGTLDGPALIKNLDRIGREMGEEMFGGSAGLQKMYDLGEAAQSIVEGAAIGGRTMYVKLAQGGVLASTAFRDWGDVSKSAKLSALGLFVAPVVLAREVIGNPKFTQAVIDGMTSSVGSEKFNKAAAQMIALSGKDYVLSEGLKRIYDTDSAHATVNPSDLPQGVEQQLQFIPSDTMEREMIRQYNSAEEASMALGGGN